MIQFVVNKCEGDVIVKFGHGDIAVSSWRYMATNRYVLQFKTMKTKLNIGEDARAIEKHGPAVGLFFERVESIDILLKHLGLIKEKMKGNMNGNDDENDRRMDKKNPRNGAGKGLVGKTKRAARGAHADRERNRGSK